MTKGMADRLLAGAGNDALRAALSSPGSKMGNRHTVVDGITFDSQAEANRYSELKQWRNSGGITKLMVHPKFRLVVNGIEVGVFEADFSYYLNGVRVVEDVKGQRSGTPYSLFKIKKNLMKACLGIEVQEIKVRRR